MGETADSTAPQEKVAFPKVPTEVDVNEEELYKVTKVRRNIRAPVHGALTTLIPQIMGLVTPEGEPLKAAADEEMIKKAGDLGFFFCFRLSFKPPSC